jgi:hypothetical protein
MTKKIIILFTAALFASLTAPVFAQVGPVTGDLFLKGTVPQILQITVNAVGAAQTLDLSVDEAGLVVASVTERSNKKGGYSISLSSVNDGVLKSVDPANTDWVPYQISYGIFAAQPTLTPAVAVTETGKTTGTGVTRDVLISFSAPAQILYADDYSDTLTFTISAP